MIQHTIDKVLAIDFETANGQRTSACSVGLVLFDYKTECVLERKHLLIDPEEEFSFWNTRIHCLTADDVADAPNFSEVFPTINDLISSASIVVAHNASFDMGVFTRSAEKAGLEFDPFDFCCTVALSIQILPDLENHKLHTVARCFHLGDFQHHRADDDAEVCGKIFLKFAKAMGAISKEDITKYSGVQLGRAYAFGYDSSNAYGMSYVRGKCSENAVNISGNGKLFEGKSLVFTGVFSSMSRTEAEKTAIDLGGKVCGSVSKKIDYLVCGVQDLKATKGNEKSSKQIKAEELASHGIPIRILTEKEYREMIFDCNCENAELTVEFEQIVYPKDVNERWGSNHTNYRNTEIDEEFVRNMPGRVPVERIIHDMDSDEAFSEGYEYFLQGENARRENNYERAIRLFDCARYIGYAMPALYNGYAKLFRKMEDYESELAILEEGIERGVSVIEFSERQEKVRQIIRRNAEKAELLLEKQNREEEKRKEKQRKQEIINAAKFHEPMSVKAVVLLPPPEPDVQKPS